MSTAVLPSLVGLGFDVVRTPKWDTTVQASVSGLETRIANQTYARYEWELTFDILRSSATYLELQQLMGFFNARQGMFDTFLYQDADDNAITGQSLGNGDGTNRTFQLIRAFGGFIEPVFAPNVVSKVYVDGVDAAGNWSVSTWGSASPGIVTFSMGHAPASGKAVTADFTYYWPVRMTEDSVSFNMFMSQMYKAPKFGFISVKN